MVFEKYAIPVRVLALFLVCLVLFYSCIVPVHAAALLYEVLAVTARSMVASLIRACGVYVADGVESEISSGLQSFESLTDSVLTYVWEHLPDNLKVVNTLGQLMIKMVLKNGVYYAPRTLVELVCAGISANVDLDSIGYTDYSTQFGYLFNTTDDLKAFNDYMNSYSGSQKYGEKLGKNYWIYCYVLHMDVRTNSYSADTFHSYLPDDYVFILTASDQTIGFQLDGEELYVIYPSNSSHYLISGSTDLETGVYSVFGSTYSVTDSYSSLFYVNSFSKYKITRQEGITPSTALSGLSFEDDVATIDSSWSAKGISVDDDKLDNAAVSMIPVSVYDPSSAATASKSDVIAGSRVDAETETVTDSVTDTITDSTTQTGFWSSVVGLLNSILTAVKSLIGGITTPIVNAIAEVVAAVKAIAIPTTAEPPGFDSMTLPSLKNFFPFCIPFDLYAMMQALCADPVAPCFTFATSFLGHLYTVDIDLSPWEDVAVLVRYMITAIHIVALTVATRKFIKW